MATQRALDGTKKQINQRSARGGESRQRLIVNGWVDAALTVGTGVGSMLVLTALLLFWFGSELGLPPGQLIPASAIGIAMAVGGTLDVSFGGTSASTAGASPSLTGSFTASATTITIVGFGLLAVMFLARLRARQIVHPTNIAKQAIRVWIVLLGLLAAVCLLGKVHLSDNFASSVLASVYVTTEFTNTLLFGSCWLGSTLLIAVSWKMPGSLPRRIARWRTAASPAIAGALAAITVSSLVLSAMVIVITVLAAVSASAEVAGPPSGEVWWALAVIALIGPGLSLAIFGFGVGIPLIGGPGLTGDGSSVLGLAGSDGSTSIFGATDLDSRFWLVPVFATLALVVGGIVTALHAPSPQHARRTCWRLGVALAVALPIVAIDTAFSAGGAAFGVAFGGDSGFHLDYMLAVVLGLVWGTLAGWVGAALAPKMPDGLITSVRARIDRARSAADYGSTP